MADDKCIWKERKRLLLFGLPWTFTIYSLDSEALNVQTGFFSQKFEEIKLYRIRDFIIKESCINGIIPRKNLRGSNTRMIVQTIL